MPLGNPIRKQNESRMVSVLATEGQTVFTVQGGYIINHISVFRNGVRLSPAEDFTAGDGSTVTLNDAANVEDRIDFHVFDRFTVQNAIIGAASTQTINGDLVLNGKLFGALDVPSINLTGIITATELDLNGKGDISGDLTIGRHLNVVGVTTLRGLSIFGNTTGLQVASGISTFQAVTGTTGTFSGAVSGTTGTFSDDVTVTGSNKKLISNSTSSGDYVRVYAGGGTGKWDIYGNGADLRFSDNDSAGVVRFDTDVSIADKIIHTGDTNTAIRFPAADTITAETGGSERMRITSAGKVGIGSVTPTGAVDIASGSNSYFKFGQDSDNPKLEIFRTTGNASNTHYGAELQLLTGDFTFSNAPGADLGNHSYTERLRITAAGDVGIGVADPDAKLEVLEDIYVKGSSGDGSVGIQIRSGSSALSNQHQIRTGGGSGDQLFIEALGGSSAIVTKVAGSERMRITSAGLMGIGINNPARILHLHESSSDTCQLHITNSTTGTTGSDGVSFALGSDESLIINQRESNSILLKTADTEAMRIDSGGRLLHGVTSSIDVCSVAPSRLQVHNNASVLTASFTGYGAHAGGSVIALGKSRSNTVGDATGAVTNNDTLGDIRFGGSDGTDMENTACAIRGEVDGSVSSNTIPGRLVFSTNSGSGSAEHMRIDSSGRVLIGTVTEGESTADNLTIGDTGNCGITIRSGTGSEGNIFFSDGTSGSAEYRGTIQYNQNDDRFVFFTAGTERMRIDSTGALSFTAANNGQIIHSFRNNDTTASSYAMTVEHWFRFNRTGGGMDSPAAKIIAGKEREWVGGASNQDGYLAFHTLLNETSAEKMRILSGGNMYLGDSVSASGLGNSRGFIFETSGTQQIVCATTSGKNVMEFNNPNGNVGRITTSGSSTAYNTSSDYRLKENETTISDGITRLKTLIPRRFNWKADSTNTLEDGFFAHEVTAVPEAISGVKDETYTEDNPVKGISKGDPLYQMIDQSKLVPLLTAALQEAVAKIETLETKVAALEGS